MKSKFGLSGSALWVLLGAACNGGDGCHLNSPVFIAQPQSQTVTVGQKVTFHADYSDKSQNAGFQWLKNGVNYGAERFVDTDLIINSVALSDSGTYSVIITYYGCRTMASSSSSGAILTVQNSSSESAPNQSFNSDPAATIAHSISCSCLPVAVPRPVRGWAG